MTSLPPPAATRRADPRSPRTIAALRSGVRLALAQDPPDLSAAHICRLAGVNRTSFYTHFTSVSDLLVSTMTTEIVEMLRLPPAQTDRSDSEEVAAFEQIARPSFTRMAADRSLFRAAFASPESGHLRIALRDAVAEQVARMIDRWEAEGRIPTVDRDVVLAYSASGFVGVLEAWCEAAEEDADPDRWVRGLEQTIPAWWPSV